MIFPYSASLAEDPETGDFLIYRRPEVGIRLGGESNSVKVTGLVDTGADLTIFPLRLAKRLRIPVAPASEGLGLAFGGSAISLFVGEARLELEHEGEAVRWRDSVWFCDFPAAEESTIVLGHAGFLDYFRAEFDGKERSLTLTPNEDLPSE